MEKTSERETTTQLPTGGGCGCGCCGPTTQKSREEEIAELLEVREATERRIAELEG